MDSQSGIGRRAGSNCSSMDLVLIPTYNRPDYLRLCLEYLSRAEGIQTKEVHISVDRGKSLIREIYEVVNDFRNQLNITVSFREPHDYHGNSFNTLEAYKEAYTSNAKFVYLVEDDVLVQPDFFKWHEAVQAEDDFMCSIAYRCSRNPACSRIHEHDPEAYFVSARDYASIGVCWRREKLAEVVKHACTEYYQNMNDYILKNFPNNRFYECFTEQDGLIMRIMGETHGLTAWPYMPRAYHIGFAGYHRLRSPRLSYNEIKEVIHDSEKVRQTDRDFHDIEAVPTTLIPEWKKLYQVQRFD